MLNGTSFSPIARVLCFLAGAGLAGCSASLNDPPAAATTNAAITGTPIVADGITPCPISITLVDDNGIPLVGAVPTFSATDTMAKNVYGPCTSSSSAGKSTCWMKSTYAETKTLSITYPISFTGSTVVFSPAPETQITIGTEPSANAVAGVAFTTQPSFQIRDPLGNLVLSPATPVTLSAFTDATCTTPGTGVLSATNNPQNSSAGIATFSGLNYTKAGPLYLKASAPGLLPACTSLVTVVHNVANKLGFQTEPSPTAIAGVMYATQPVVQVLDFWNNFVNDGATATQTITLSAWNNPTCSSTPTGVFGVTTNPVTSAAGLAPFTGVNHTRATTIYLQAAATGLAPACSTVTTVAPYVADPTMSSITGTTPVAANSYHYSTITITIEDEYANPRPGDLPTFSATNSGNDNIYGACSAANSSGVSTCTLKSSTVETKTLSITSPVNAVGGTVHFIIPPAAGNSSITGSGPVIADNTSTSIITIVLKDASNQPVVGIAPAFQATDTGITNGYSGCSVSNSSGVSTCTMTSRKAETKTLQITQPLALTGGTVVFTNGAASYMTFTAAPTSGTAGVVLSTSPIVKLWDVYGNPVLVGADATKSVTLKPYDDATCSTNATGALSTSANPLAASAGVVTYSNVSYTKAQTLYLGAVAAGVTQACTGAISIIHNSPTHLNFATEPSATATAGTPFASQPSVQILDFYGNVVNSGASSTAPITLSPMTSGCAASVSAAYLSATNNPLSATAGTATFSNTYLTKASTLALQASGASLPMICSTAIAVSAGAASASTITGTGPVTADGTSTSTITITVVDAYGNAYASVTPTFGATDSGSTNQYGNCGTTNTSGVTTCTLTSRRAETKTLQLLTPYSKAGGNVVFSAGAPYMLAFSVLPPSSETAGVSLSINPVAQVQDQYGNAVLSATNAITLAPFQNSACTTPGTMSISATANPVNANGTNGAATFTSVTYTKTEPLYLRASATGLQLGCTELITVNPAGANAANSSISATSGITADGSSTSTVSIVLKDTYGNPLTGTVPSYSVTGTSNALGTCSAVNASGSSTCTFTSTKAENKTVALTSPIALAGNVVTFTPGPAAQLVFITQPSSSANAGVNLSQSPSVQVQDASGNVLPTSTLSITLSATTNVGCTSNGTGTLSAATNPVAANGTTGTATFANVNYTASGPLYLKAAAGSVIGCSSLVTISPAAPAALQFSVEPSTSSLVRTNWATAPTVKVLDAYGNFASTAMNSITLTAYDDAGCSTTLSAGTLTAAANPLSASSGTAAFTGASFSTEDTIHLKASATGLTSACSTAVQVYRWQAISSASAPSARTLHTAVWTGSQMIVWGGVNGSTYYNTGAIYTPASDTWSPIAVDANTPSARENHTAVWTGSEMIIFGGDNGTGALNDGARYNVSTNSWTALPAPRGTVAARTGHSAVWTGSQMIVWGGEASGTYFASGGVYTLANNTWAATNLTGGPSARASHTAIWTGTDMLVFGGFDGAAYHNDGGDYNPSGAGSWTAIPNGTAPSVRSEAVATWSGSQMFIWGGTNGSTPLDTGGLYATVGDVWTAVSTTAAPAARAGFTGVWTGSSAIVWGGVNGSQLNSGGVYAPGTSTWTATSTSQNLPLARSNHTAVWTGSEMIIWGGCLSGSPICSSVTATGAFYLP